MRNAKVNRVTKETSVELFIEIDGKGKASVTTGIPFFDHLLINFAKHGLFDLTIKAKGDLEVDDHHTVEDVAICLGRAIKAALGDKKGIQRIGNCFYPMDDALAFVGLDISGRGICVTQLGEFKREEIGKLHLENIKHFFETFAREGGINIFAKILTGENEHHKIEALFKALGKALDEATKIDKRIEGVKSSKGVL